MGLARDVGSHLHAVGEADASNLTDSGVRFARGLRGHLGTHAALEGRWVECRAVLERIKTTSKRRLTRLRRFCFASLLGQLIDGGH